MNNKFIKNKIKYKKGGTSPPINTAVKFPPETDVSNDTGSNKKKNGNDVNLTDTQKNDLIQGLKDILTTPINNVELSGINENNIDSICQAISSKEVLYNLNKKFYSTLDTCFNGIKLKVENHELMKNGKFNVLLFNKLIHGKLNEKWLPKLQIDNLKKN